MQKYIGVLLFSLLKVLILYTAYKLKHLYLNMNSNMGIMATKYWKETSVMTTKDNW